MIRREIAEENAAIITAAQIIIQRQGGLLTDAEILTIVKAMETWAPGRPYGLGQAINHEGITYRVETEVLQSETHQSPGSEGMLAVYRPIVKEHSGSLDDPIPYIYGMDSISGKYYSYENKLYRCTQNMIPCVWPPGTAGVWQWELITQM